MTRSLVLSLVVHGMLLFLVGLVLGLTLHQTLLAKGTVETERAWRASHTTLVTGGTFYLALAGVGHLLRLGQRAARLATGALALASYVFTVVFVAGPLLGARGLAPVGPPSHVAVYAGFLLAIVLMFAATLVFAWGAWAAYRASRAS